ncbi:MAG: hypothetical protein RJA26_388 [Actinomycetota bacterium]
MLVTNSKIARGLWFFLAALLVVIADQTAKDAAIAFLQPRVSYEFMGNLVRLYLTYNDSAAFSIGFGQTWIFTIISAAAALALLWYRTRIQTLGWALLAGTALGGVTGNLIDRLSRAPGFPAGQVVDFIQIPFNFPIFNIADSAICIVAVIVVIQIARGRKLGG